MKDTPGSHTRQRPPPPSPVAVYINGVKQDEYTLPEGPILLSPTSLMRSFHNEVILKVSDRFKTACLRDVLHLFPKGSSYYAGFGNRTTDINAYQQVGVRSPRIFIINPHGQVQVPTSAYRTSYSKLDDMVDVLFPPISARAATDTSFNSFEYWQSSVPEVSTAPRPPNAPWVWATKHQRHTRDASHRTLIPPSSWLGRHLGGWILLCRRRADDRRRSRGAGGAAVDVPLT